MLFFEKESEMPLGEISKSSLEGDVVHHLVCEGSRRHVVSYTEKGRECSHEKCEINHPSEFSTDELLKKETK